MLERDLSSLQLDKIQITKDKIFMEWHSPDLGFGEYVLVKDNGKWYGESETMDYEEDKNFGKKLLELFMEDFVEIIN